MTALSAPSPTGTPATLLTADEFTARCANVHAELVKGIVKEYPVPYPKHGFICSCIDRLIGIHAEAEPLLLHGYDGLKERQKTLPPSDRSCLSEAADRLVQMYAAWGKKEEAERWRRTWETHQTQSPK